MKLNVLKSLKVTKAKRHITHFLNELQGLKNEN